jgi:hypothetical protein
MPKTFCAIAWLLLTTAAIILPGCATNESDLNYTREKPTTDAAGDHSYHGWNDANY